MMHAYHDIITDYEAIILCPKGDSRPTLQCSTRDGIHITTIRGWITNREDENIRSIHDRTDINITGQIGLCLLAHAVRVDNTVALQELERYAGVQYEAFDYIIPRLAVMWCSVDCVCTPEGS